MNEFRAVFGRFSFDQVILFIAAIAFLVWVLKQAIKWLQGMMRKIDDITRKLDIIEELKNQFEANQRATVAMQRNKIREDCRDAKAKGSISSERLDSINMMFDAYSDMGDNGSFATTKKMVEEVNRLPAIEEED